ncbi:YIP1 family protein [Paenibacillus sp. FA6]|uniref:YIP1 family protein n=1 Tax=Paenibacillus sp. FA6 TaxID=3413029 RepID=UPI003F65DCCE
MKRFVLLLLLASIIFVSLPMAAYAELPYRTFYYDDNQSTWLRLQPIYEPANMDAVKLTEPVDLQIGPNDNVYVTDKSTGHVVVLSQDGEVLQTFGDEEGSGALNSPEGMYVTPDGTVYVADSGNQRIAVFNADGSFEREYKKPESSLLEGQFFVPIKIAVDRRGVMYVNLNSSYQGLLRMDSDGEFKGYFGANKAQQTVMSWIKKLILNKEQLAKELANLPRPINNIHLDDDGFLFTATAGGFGKAAIRKLNAGGVDAFKGKTVPASDGIIDMATDSNHLIYSIDSVVRGIVIYDDTAEPLFSYGFVDKDTQQYGVIGFPTGIDVDSNNNVWISDSRIGTVHKFTRTEFGTDLMQALALYKEGRYLESEPYWNRVYARNDMYNGTFQGLGKVYLHKGEYDAALDYLKTAFDTESYSKAFWQIRLQWLQQNFPLVASIVIVLVAILMYGPKLIRMLLKRYPLPKKWDRPLYELKLFKNVMFHPYEEFYKLKESKVTGWVIWLILLGVVAVKICSLFLTGFIFNPIEASQLKLLSPLAFFIAPWVTWIIANYLVCSVRDGEGRFREVIQGSVYALSPYFFLTIPMILLSNILTLEERIIIDALYALMLIWQVVMLIVMTQVIHNFDFTETLGNIGITAFTIGVIWIFLFIISGLSYNLYDFFYQLYKEATFIG